MRRESIVLGVVLLARAAGATLNLSGEWTAQVNDAFLGPTILPVTLTQTGTALTWVSTSPGVVTATGAIDSTTGAFVLHGPPGSSPIGEIPGLTIDAVASGSNHFSGTYAYGFFKATPPPCIPYCIITDPLVAVRAGAPVCGDGAVDPPEQCDHGTANGQDGCCTPGCTLVDPDLDGVCSAVDICPTVYDPDQSVGCLDLEKASIRPKLSSGKLKAQGTLGPLPSGRQLADIAGVRAEVDTVAYVPNVAGSCGESGGRLRCRGKGLSLNVSPRRHAGLLSFKLRFTYTSQELYGAGTVSFGISLLDANGVAVLRGSPGFFCLAAPVSFAAHCPP